MEEMEREKETKERILGRKGMWCRCATYQMDSDAKVNNDIIKVENKWCKL